MFLEKIGLQGIDHGDLFIRVVAVMGTIAGAVWLYDQITSDDDENYFIHFFEVKVISETKRFFRHSALHMPFDFSQACRK